MKKLDNVIIGFYQNKYWSTQQVATYLKITPSKVNYTLGKHGIKKRSISDAIRYLNITKHNKGVFKIKKRLAHNDEMLKMAGVMLYWGEGTKKGGTVGFSNSDPDMIRLYLKFLRRICGISNQRMKGLIHYYPDHNKDELINFWSKITQLPPHQFTKPYVHQSKKGTYKKYSVYGTISLRYADKKLLEIINLWIKDEINKI